MHHVLILSVRNEAQVRRRDLRVGGGVSEALRSLAIRSLNVIMAFIRGYLIRVRTNALLGTRH